MSETILSKQTGAPSAAARCQAAQRPAFSQTLTAEPIALVTRWTEIDATGLLPVTLAMGERSGTAVRLQPWLPYADPSCDDVSLQLLLMHLPQQIHGIAPALTLTTGGNAGAVADDISCDLAGPAAGGWLPHLKTCKSVP